ncbi:MAG: OmpA family protein [Methylococcales bacterium]
MREEFIRTEEINRLPETRTSDAGGDLVTEPRQSNLLAASNRDQPKPSDQPDSSVVQPIEIEEKPLKTAGTAGNRELERDSRAGEQSPASKFQMTTILEYVFPTKFAFGSKRLPKISKQDLASINDFLAGCGKEIQVVGHTCDIGSDSYNRRLGLTRADAVTRFITTRTQFRGSFTVLSVGAENPAFPNSSAQNRGLNRRVVLHCSAIMI